MKNRRGKTVLAIAAVAILALAIGQVQAEMVTVPNGTFHMYKPGTTIPVVNPAGDIWVQQLGMNRPLSGGGPVTFDDGTTGDVVDIPGWITPIESQGSDTGSVDLFQTGFEPTDGSSTANCFGAWSGQNGNLAESAESLGNIVSGATYTLSAMRTGLAGPVTFELRAGGVPMTPSSSVTPIPPLGTWEVISRTYDRSAIAGHIGEPITIVFGTSRPGEGEPELTGTRTQFDNISLSYEIGFQASNPIPADEATDVLRDVVLSWTPGILAAPVNGHKVYFGESFDDVNDATGAVAQTAASYAPAQRLDFGTTYYWRVDEVNAPPTSHVEFKSEVWSFTTEPIGYPIENVTATASSALPTIGPENTVNGSGMDANDLHSIEQADMWVSGSEPEGAWIEFEFDRVYKLHEMLVWNSNQMIEYIIGFGCKGVTIEYSADGTNWTELVGVPEFAQAPGTPGYAHNTTIDFAGAVAKKVRLTISSNWGFLPQYSLSEVRFFYIPVRAREPQPDSGAIDTDVDVTLSFRAGRGAAEHNVYISADEQAVMDSTADVTSVTETSHGPLLLDLGRTYYWKVNEVNDAETPTMWEGDIWNFTTKDSFVVEDFEDYNDYPGYRIYETWADGWEIPTNGAMIGYPEPLNFAAGEHILETTDVHSGEQSLPFFYDNSTAASSEASVNIADLQIGGDWTGNGVNSLSLWFYGDPNNTAEQMYVKLNGVKALYYDDAGNISNAAWQPFNINLTDFTGVDLSNVTELGIGFERIGFSGGSGMVLFDDIRLYPIPEPEPTP